MSQRVPNCDLDDNNNNNIINTPTKIPLLPSFNFISHEVPMLGYTVGKPTCNKKGQPLREAGTTTWDSFKGDTLESIVNQHVAKSHHNGLVTVDALVPCFEKQGMQKVQNSGERVGACCSARVGSGDGFVVGKEDVPKRSATVARGDVTHDLSLSGAETCARDSSVAFNSLSMGSPENTTSSGKQCTGTTANDDRDSISHRMPQSETREEDYKATRVDRSSESNKRIKTSSAVHNQSERRRRDKINQRMKELQKLVPNSSKTDKASMLDEVIQYMKQLQAQLQMMNWMKMYSSMMLPITMQQQQLKMSMMMAQMGIGMGMNKDMVMSMNNMMNMPIVPPIFQLPPFMPMASCADPLQAAQHKSMMDAYSKMAAMYHQLHQSSDSSSKT